MRRIGSRHRGIAHLGVVVSPTRLSWFHTPNHVGSPTGQIRKLLIHDRKNRFPSGLTYLTIPLLTESLTEKRRLLGLRHAGSRPLAAPDRFAILPPGIPMMSRLRQRAFVCLGYGAAVAPLSPAHRQDPPSKWLSRKAERIGRAPIERAGEAKTSPQARFPARPASF